MKALVTTLLATLFALSLTACGCSSNMPIETQPPVSTILPDTIPTLDTNIPDPEVDTQMPIYTDGADSSINTEATLPSEAQKNSRK